MFQPFSLEATQAHSRHQREQITSQWQAHTHSHVAHGTHGVHPVRAVRAVRRRVRGS